MTFSSRLAHNAVEMAETEHSRETRESWVKAEQHSRATRAYHALITIRSTIDRGDTATGDAVSEVLGAMVRENLPDSAALLHRVEKIYS